MRTYTAVAEKDKDTGLYVGYVPNFPGAHSQGETLDELQQNLREVLEMLLEDEVPQIEAEFVGTQQIIFSGKFSAFSVTSCQTSLCSSGMSSWVKRRAWDSVLGLDPIGSKLSITLTALINLFAWAVFISQCLFIAIFLKR